MPLDPKLRDVIAALGAQEDRSHLTIAERRELIAASAVSMEASPAAVARTQDIRIPGPGGDIPARVYWPRTEEVPGVFVHLHGGGWWFGDYVGADPHVRGICDAAGCGAVSINYRLAPEHPYPAPLEDCYAATKWVADNAQALGFMPGMLAVGGSSAGGNLAAGVALLARDRGGPSLALQVLDVPALDPRCDSASVAEFGDGFLLTTNALHECWRLYLGPDAANVLDPYAAPARAQDLAGLPPALVITAECDPLRDEAEAYAKRLKESGGIVTLSRYEGMVHGFTVMYDALPAARAARVEVGAALRDAFSRAAVG